jgi:phosphoribosyl 1,2-cyclic phosphodiesterase
LKLCILASGSHGNAAWIRSGPTALLVDCGLSFRALKQRLAAVGEDLGRLRGVIITHEHADHISGLPILQRKTGVPIFATAGTAEAAAERQGVNGFELIQAGQKLGLGAIEFFAFPVSHDAADPVGLVLEAKGVRLGLATDLGLVTRLVEQRLSRCQILVLEANHDPRMLRDGPYAWEVKQRIQSRFGHLANEKAGQLLRKLLHSDLGHVFLAHRSEINNTPALQRAAAEEAIGGRGAAIHLTWQERPAETVEI